MNPKDKHKLDQLITKASDIISCANDDDIPSFIGDGILQHLIEAIVKPKLSRDQSIYDYLLENKRRLQLLALIRLSIQHNYSIKGKVGFQDVFVSPNEHQWFDDGVMFFQGKERFAGLIGLYQGGRVKFGIVKRDIRGGDKIGPDDLQFVDVDEMTKRFRQPRVPKDLTQLDARIVELEQMLARREKRESKYQRYFSDNFWVFGAQYKQIDSHLNLDDEKIPDFTGVRIKDLARDIIEIKPPFLPLFSSSGSFRAEFNNAWNKAEQYLDFAQTEADYLYRQKGLIFDNPRCYLVAGFNLAESLRKKIKRKEHMNPLITFLTYNDVLSIARSTVGFVKLLKGRGGIHAK